MHINKRRLVIAFCTLFAYFAIWYAYPSHHYHEVRSFIAEWNASSKTPYRIEYDGISIKRSLWSSPISSTITISNMRLIFKDSRTVIPSEADLELSTRLFCETSPLIVHDYFDS